MKHFYFATSNRNKIAELQAIALKLGGKVSQFVIEGGEPEETGATFQENSAIKLAFYKKHFNNDGILATEDSGLEIPLLNNFPSIHSARFLKQFPTKSVAFMELQQMLQNAQNPIKASFVCDICTGIGGKIHHFTGKTHGTITFQSIEDEGFGYDPIFIPETSDTTFSQMKTEEKNAHSHRTKAFQQLINFL